MRARLLASAGGSLLFLASGWASADPMDPAIERLGGLGRFFDRGWGIDPAVSWFMDKPGRAAASRTFCTAGKSSAISTAFTGT